MIKQLLNSAIAKYRDLSVARRSNICLCLRHRQIIDLLATDKSRYFAQSRPIIVYYYRQNYCQQENVGFSIDVTLNPSSQNTSRLQQYSPLYVHNKSDHLKIIENIPAAISNRFLKFLLMRTRFNAQCLYLRKSWLKVAIKTN